MNNLHNPKCWYRSLCPEEQQQHQYDQLERRHEELFGQTETSSWFIFEEMKEEGWDVVGR